MEIASSPLSCSNKLYECSSSTLSVKLDTLNGLRFKLNCIFTPEFMYWCRGTGLHESVCCLSRAKRLHQALGLQQTTTGELILYLHTRQDRQHLNAASGITNSIPMYTTEISLFCGLSSTAFLLRLYISFLLVSQLNPSHITQSTPDSDTSSKMLSPHMVLLALTASPSPGSDNAMFLTTTPENILHSLCSLSILSFCYTLSGQTTALLKTWDNNLLFAFCMPKTIALRRPMWKYQSKFFSSKIQHTQCYLMSSCCVGTKWMTLDFIYWLTMEKFCCKWEGKFLILGQLYSQISNIHSQMWRWYTGTQMKQVTYFFKKVENMQFSILFSRRPESFMLKHKKKEKSTLNCHCFWKKKVSLKGYTGKILKVVQCWL